MTGTILLMAVAILATWTAQAAMIVPVTIECDKTANMVKHLEQTYKVLLQQQGLGTSGDLVQLWVDKDGKFSLIAVSPKGISCYLIGGTDWNAVKAPVKGQGT